MVHLLTALVPRASFRVPKHLLLPTEAGAAVAALKEVEGLIAVKTPLAEALASLADAKAARQARPAFLEATDLYRLALQGFAVKDPLRRIDLHQALMAAGFYAKAVDLTVVGDPIQFLVQHYNFDIRRDSIIAKCIHQTIIEHHQSTAESDETLKSLLLIERKLFGPNRLHMKNSGQGHQQLCMGVPLKEVTDEKELDRILALPPIKEVGNFVKRYDDPDPELKDPHKFRWKNAIVSCGPEPEPPMDPTNYPKEEAEWILKILKPAPPVPFWGRVRQRLLELWVLVFTFWAMFFMVDEEIITFIALVYTRWNQKRILRIESEKAGGAKIYVAQSQR